ncbi:hypothetical protein AXW84_13115 [Hymenobacter sp. PAMC 26628]|nr:hypothetical protein AXW84_13115 [Hymenobacter sp. PAMC 26628]
MRLSAATASSALLLACSANSADPKATAVADRVMTAMGGTDAWNNTRYLAWDFFRGQYQIWDKQTGDFHWEQDTLVANYT